jgi:hypothetical protein
VHFLEDARVQLLQARAIFQGKTMQKVLRAMKFIAIPAPDKSAEEMKTALENTQLLACIIMLCINIMHCGRRC